MTYLRSLPADSALLAVFRAYPDTAGPLLDLHEQVMRQPSPLSQGERELIAAYVSARNQCAYCHGVHAVTAQQFGVPAEVVPQLLSDVDTADVDEPLKPLLRYVGTLTTAPSTLSAADADAVFAAGWDDAALHDAVTVAALFNFMNRMVTGLGIEADERYFATSGQRLYDHGYAGLAAVVSAGHG